MPYTYPNPYGYTSPIGDALAKLSAQLMSGPSEAKRISDAEAALKAKTQREGTATVADVFSRGVPVGDDLNRAMSGAVLGGYDPQKLSVLQRFGAANTYGATDPRTANAQVGAGNPFSATAPAFFTDQSNTMARAANALNENARQFNQTPQEAMVGGQPAFVPRAGAFDPGVAPMVSETDAKGALLSGNWGNLQALSPEQQTVLGANKSPGSIKMYRTKDGVIGRTANSMTDMVTGEPIPADARIGSISDTSETFGTTEMSKAREGLIGRRQGVESMILQATRLDEMLAQADAGAAVGVLGAGARIINDIAAQAQAAFQLAGKDAPAALRDAVRYENTFRELGIDNAEMQSSLVDLAYAVAQSREPGRLTEADIDRALRTLGGNLQDPIAMRRVLRSAVERSLSDYGAAESVMRGAYGDSLNLPAANFSQMPAIGGAPAGGVKRFERGPDGALRRVQ